MSTSGTHKGKTLAIAVVSLVLILAIVFYITPDSFEFLYREFSMFEEATFKACIMVLGIIGFLFTIKAIYSLIKAEIKKI